MMTFFLVDEPKLLRVCVQKRRKSTFTVQVPWTFAMDTRASKELFQKEEILQVSSHTYTYTYIYKQSHESKETMVTNGECDRLFSHD